MPDGTIPESARQLRLVGLGDLTPRSWRTLAVWRTESEATVKWFACVHVYTPPCNARNRAMKILSEIAWSARLVQAKCLAFGLHAAFHAHQNAMQAAIGVQETQRRGSR